MKRKSQEQSEPQEIKLEFVPFPSGSGYCAVRQVMPDGSKKWLGYVGQREFRNGDHTYFTSSCDNFPVCPPTASWQTIMMGFEKYAIELAKRERRAEDVDKIRERKNQKAKEISINR